MATIKYTGDGTEFINAVPAKNLTTEDYDALDTDQRAAVRKSPLYDYDGYKQALDKDAADKAAATAQPAAEQTGGEQ